VLFREFDSEFARTELEEHIKAEFLHKADVRWRVGQAWAVRSTTHKLIEIFYEVGVIGVWRPRVKSFVYSFEDRDAQFSAPDKLAVHPGLRAFLETK
jgi:hypothetical protein